MTLTRYLTFKLDGVDWALAYKLTSPTAVATTWSLKPPPTAGRSLLKSDAAASILINIAITGNQPVAGLRVVLDPVEQQTKRPLSKGGWKLCKTDGTPDCSDEPVTLTGAGIHTLWAVPSKLDKLDPGKYEAMITIASADKSSGEAVSFSLNITSWGRQIVGWVAILFGVVLATYVTVFVRNQLGRNEMLTAAVSLREFHDGIRTELDSVDPHRIAKTIREALRDVNKKLDDEALQSNGLPSLVPAPWAKSNDALKRMALT